MCLLIGLIGVIGLSSFVVSSSVGNNLIENIIVKQTMTFQDDSKVVIYYVKDDSGYYVYSETNLAKQSPTRLNSLQHSDFEKVDSYKGECYYKAKTLDEVINTANYLYSKYKNIIK